jgi:hypothetical protein
MEQISSLGMTFQVGLSAVAADLPGYAGYRI